MRAIVFGCGYSGQAIARQFLSQGHSVSATVRSAEKAEALRQEGIGARVFDGSGFDAALLARMADATHLIQSIPPTAGNDPLYSLIEGRLASLCPKLEWIGYLSTVGVYGDHAGGWVTEETPGSPILGRSIDRVSTENDWAGEAGRSGIACAALRLSGIYGPGRNAFINLTRGSARRIIKKDQVFNRIRVEDIAGATLFLAERRLVGIYNVTDDEPAAPQDVIVEAARLMGITPPPEQDFDTAEMTPMARSFYGANKRVSNTKIKAAGYQFQHPDYRVSLAQMWSSELWQG